MFEIQYREEQKAADHVAALVGKPGKLAGSTGQRSKMDGG